MISQLETARLPKLRSKVTTYRRSEVAWGILFASPAILGYLIFVLGPMITSLGLSFTDYNIVNNPQFIGVQNYQHLFSGSDPYFYKSLGVTIYYVFLSVPLDIVYSFFVALLLNQKIKGRSVFRTIFYLPTIVPIVATSVIWLWILNPDHGLLNSLLQLVGLHGGKWLFSETTVIPSLALITIWTTGQMIVVFLAGLQDISPQLYEALEVDGGTGFHKLIYITIPLMTPTIFFNLVIGLINAFQTFAQPYIMTQGGPNNASLFYVYYLFREAFQFSRMGSASAIAWVLFIVIVAITAATFKFSRSLVYYEGGDK